MRRIKTQTLVISSLLMAMHVVLSVWSINLPFVKINLSGLPIVIGGLLFGPVVGALIGFIGHFIYQMVGYGLMATTIIWVIPIGVRGLIIGLYAKMKKYQLGKIETMALIIVSSIVVTVLNTFGLYMAGFLTKFRQTFWPALGTRLIPSIITAVVIGVITIAVMKPLRRYFHMDKKREKVIEMNGLKYKEVSKCNILAAITGVALLGTIYMDISGILSVFKDMGQLRLYLLVRSILPAIIIVAIGVLLVVKKAAPKIPLMLLSGYFLVEILGQFVLLSQEKNKVYLGFIATADNILKLIVTVFSIVFTMMVLFGGLKASAGSFCVTLAKGVLVFFNLFAVNNFVMTFLVAAMALFTLSSIEDYEEKPLKKIQGEHVWFERRNVGSCVILTILTCGIFGIIWLTKLCKDINKLHGDENPVGSEVLLVLFVPFYSVYWAYTKGKQMYEDSKKRGGNLTDRKVIYLIMNLLFMQLFTMGFIQTQLNSYNTR